MSRSREEFENEPLLDGSRDDHDEDDDEEFVLNPKSNGKNGVHFQNNALQQVRLQIDDATSTMRENIQKMFHRGDTLDELNTRSEGLRSASDDFYRTSNRLRKQMWWQQLRTKIVIGSFCTLIVLTLIIWLAVKHS